MEYIPSAMKCSDQSKSSLLIVSKIFEIADFDPKLSCNVPDFNEYWYSKQTQHANY